MEKNAMKLKVGSPAPLFRAPVVGGDYPEGSELDLKDISGGMPIVLYFYPKDDTPGCTKQACALRDEWENIRQRALLFGVSPDSPESHAKFIAKHQLPFPLLSDVDKEIAVAYGVWVEKSLYGRKYMGTERTTFILDAELQVAAIFLKIQPAEHFQVIEKWLLENEPNSATT